MSEHYTRLTVSASHWCPKCNRQTMHRVDDRRISSCLDCIAKLNKAKNERDKQPKG
jgi:ribosomal protein L37AE/L43A